MEYGREDQVSPINMRENMLTTKKVAMAYLHGRVETPIRGTTSMM